MTAICRKSRRSGFSKSFVIVYCQDTTGEYLDASVLMYNTDTLLVLLCMELYLINASLSLLFTNAYPSYMIISSKSMFSCRLLHCLGSSACKFPHNNRGCIADFRFHRFINSMPMVFAFRIMDCFFCMGPKVLFQVG